MEWILEIWECAIPEAYYILAVALGSWLYWLIKRIKT